MFFEYNPESEIGRLIDHDGGVNSGESGVELTSDSMEVIELQGDLRDVKEHLLEACVFECFEPQLSVGWDLALHIRPRCVFVLSEDVVGRSGGEEETLLQLRLNAANESKGGIRRPSKVLEEKTCDDGVIRDGNGAVGGTIMKFTEENRCAELRSGEISVRLCSPPACGSTLRDKSANIDASVSMSSLSTGCPARRTAVVRGQGVSSIVVPFEEGNGS